MKIYYVLFPAIGFFISLNIFADYDDPNLTRIDQKLQGHNAIFR